MAKTRTQLRAESKNYYTEQLMEYFKNAGEDILRIKDAEICFPITDSEGNEDFIKITIAIPTGANKGTEPFDGYAEAQFYEESKQAKEEKAKAAAEAKAKKIARDEAYRAKKAQQMAEREAK